MNTVILTFALTSTALVGQVSPTSAPVTPVWHSSYWQAQKIGGDQKKPLAVIFGAGKDGWTQVIRSQEAAPEIGKLLGDRYVCVYVDTATPAGKQVAQQFEIGSSVGLVLSDRAGSAQAFWHQGDLPRASLVQYLEKYGNPGVAVGTTETLQSRTSYYQPAQSYPSMGGYSAPARGGNC